MYNREGILREILQSSEYINYKTTGEKSDVNGNNVVIYRDSTQNNPSLCLSVEGAYDHKTGLHTGLIDIARKCGIDISRYRDKSKAPPKPKISTKEQEKIFEQNLKSTLGNFYYNADLDSAAKALRFYLEHGRGFRGITEKQAQLFVKSIGFRHQKSGHYVDGRGDNRVHIPADILVYPTMNEEGKIVRVQRIHYDKNTGKKIGITKTHGKLPREYKDKHSAATRFGKPIAKCRQVVVFEGMEDAMTWVFTHSSVTGGFEDHVIVTSGTPGFPMITKFMDQAIELNKKVKIICDGDVSGASLTNGVIKIPNLESYMKKGVEVLYPWGLPDIATIFQGTEGQKQGEISRYKIKDLNDALRKGIENLKEFTEGLVSITYADAKDWITELNHWQNHQASVTAREKINNSKVVKQKALADEEYRLHRDYIKSYVYDMRRNIFDDELYIKPTADSNWQLAKNLESYLKSICLTYKEERVVGARTKIVQPLKKHEVMHHLDRWRIDEAQPELLIDIPDWDGRDRIREIVEKVVARGLSEDEFYQVLCDWGSKSWAKIWNDEVQNHVLLLQSVQGVGKDVLINAITGAYRPYVSGLDLTSGEEKIYRTAGACVVGKLSEIDKKQMARAENTIKKLATDETVSRDEKYIKGTVITKNRMSMIGTANRKDILSDPTGNRRFWLIELEEIKFEKRGDFSKRTNTYPGDPFDPDMTENQAQIVAQFKAIAEKSKGADVVSEELAHRLSLHVQKQRPEQEGMDVVQDFIEVAENLVEYVLEHKQIPPHKYYDLKNDFDDSGVDIKLWQEYHERKFLPNQIVDCIIKEQLELNKRYVRKILQTFGLYTTKKFQGQNRGVRGFYYSLENSKNFDVAKAYEATQDMLVEAITGHSNGNGSHPDPRDINTNIDDSYSYSDPTDPFS